MKKLFRLGLVCFVLTLILVGCARKETGEISIDSPDVGMVVRVPYNGVSNLSTVLKISSTFETEKNVKIFLTSPSGLQGPWDCLVPAGKSNYSCPGVPLTVPGTYIVTVQAYYLSGNISEATAVFSWVPYIGFDKSVSVLGANNASWGYFVAYLIVMIVFAILMFLMTKDLAKMFLVLGILTLLIIPLTIYIPSAGIASWMSCYLVPLAVVFLATAINLFRNPRPNLVIIRRDGTGVSYGSIKYRSPKKQVMVREMEINKDLEVQESLGFEETDEEA